MKKKKTTDSILKDIFDPIGKPESPEAHPLTRLVNQESGAVDIPVFDALREELVDDTPLEKISPGFLTEPTLPVTPAQGVTRVLDKPVRNSSWAVPAVVGLTVAALALAAVGFLSSQLDSQAREAQDLLETRRKQLASFEEKSAAGNRETDTIRRLTADVSRDRKNFGAALEALKGASLSATPKLGQAFKGLALIDRKQVWFEDFSLKDKKVLMRGFTLDTVWLYKIVSAMNTSGAFRNARIVNSQERNDGPVKMQVFQLEAILND